MCLTHMPPLKNVRPELEKRLKSTKTECGASAAASLSGFAGFTAVCFISVAGKIPFGYIFVPLAFFVAGMLIWARLYAKSVQIKTILTLRDTIAARDVIGISQLLPSVLAANETRMTEIVSKLINTGNLEGRFIIGDYISSRPDLTAEECAAKAKRSETSSVSEDENQPICPMCGRRFSAGDSFCSGCGAKLKDESLF